jgi:hypothetical protein
MTRNVRKFVGQVSGGSDLIFDLSRPFNFNYLGVHAIGRSQAMAEMLLHVAYLKASGIIGSQEPPVSFTGARFQDFKGTGTSDYVRAHRATLSINILGKNIADFAMSPYRPHFQRLLIAPQAVTDPLPPPANYGDRLMEIVSAEPTMQTVVWVLRRQPAHQPVERYLVLDGIDKLLRQHQQSYVKAIDKADVIRRKKALKSSPLAFQTRLPKALARGHP